MVADSTSASTSTINNNSIIGVVVSMVCLLSLLVGNYFYYCGFKRINSATAAKGDEFMLKLISLSRSSVLSYSSSRSHSNMLS